MFILYETYVQSCKRLEPAFRMFSPAKNFVRSFSVYLCMYVRGAFNKFPDIFVQAFKIVVDS